MKIFYHNDNDGAAAAAMVYHYAKNKLNEKIKSRDFIKVNYNKSVPNADLVCNNEKVFIVDYSFTKNSIDQLRKIRNKTSNIIWLDHHKSSLETLDIVKEERLTSYTEIDTNRCGAKIAYDYLIKNNNIFDDDTLKNVERIIDLVDDYDRWVHQYEESLVFNIGSTAYDTHPRSGFWVSINIDKVVNKGKFIKSIKDEENKKYCKTYSYTCTINGHKCIVLNTPESSSRAFGDSYKDYNLAVRYIFNGHVYQYSIYSELEDIDCSKIANKINPSGGGHKGAAGCVSSKLEFLPDVEYTF